MLIMLKILFTVILCVTFQKHIYCQVQPSIIQQYDRQYLNDYYDLVTNSSQQLERGITNRAGEHDEMIQKYNQWDMNLPPFVKDQCTNYTFVDPKCKGEDPEIDPKRDVNSTDFPYIISIQFQLSEECFRIYCGGTLIAPSIVLTVAHCYELFEYYYGYSDAEYFAAQAPQCRHEPGFKRVRVKEIVTKEDFDLDNFENDIGLLFLEEDLPGPVIDISFSESIKLDSFSKLGTVGYGVDENNFDPEAYNKIPLNGGFNLEYRRNEVCPIPITIDDSTQICTSTFPFNSNGCLGDSGSPLLFLRGKRPIQIGLLSYTFERTRIECNRGVAVYTYIVPFLPWISEKTGIDFMRKPLLLEPAPPPPPPPPPAPIELSQTDIDFLETVSLYREFACAGYDLEWDFHLALDASVIVNHCVPFDNVRETISVYFTKNLDSTASVLDVVVSAVNDLSGRAHRRILGTQTAHKIGCAIRYDCQFREGDFFIIYACVFDKPTPIDANITSCP